MKDKYWVSGIIIILVLILSVFLIRDSIDKKRTKEELLSNCLETHVIDHEWKLSCTDSRFIKMFDRTNKTGIYCFINTKGNVINKCEYIEGELIRDYIRD